MSRQKDGRYRTKITVGTTIDGKPIHKYASGRTKKELAQNVDELKKRYLGGIEVQRNVLFGERVISWHHTYKAPKIGPSTANGYMSFVISVNVLFQILCNTTLTSESGFAIFVFADKYASVPIALIKPTSLNTAVNHIFADTTLSQIRYNLIIIAIGFR